MKISKISSAALMICFNTAILIFLAELICAVAYFVEQKEITRPPIAGGGSLIKRKNSDSYDFSPLSIFVNKEGRRQEGLYAKHEIKLPPKSDKYRVFIVGGSTVANERKPPGDRISDHVESTLAAAGLSAEVFNFGVPNYTSLNELYLSLSTLVYYQPNLIIAYDGVNDAFYGSVLKKEYWKPNATDLTVNYKSRMDSAFDMPPTQRLKYFLESSSYFYYYISKLNIKEEKVHFDDLTPVEFSEKADRDTENRISISPSQYAKGLQRPNIYSDRATYNPESVRAYLNNIRAMAASLDAIGISFLHVLQPTAFTKKKLYPREKWSIDFNNAYYAGFQEVTVKTLREFRRGQQEIAKTSTFSKAQFLDLSNLTDSMDEYLYDDYCHAYKNGRLTAVVGRAIGEHILKVFNSRKALSPTSR